MYAYNDKKQSKVMGNLLKITIDFWTLCHKESVFWNKWLSFYKMSGVINYLGVIFNTVAMLGFTKCQTKKMKLISLVFLRMDEIENYSHL